MNETDSQMRLRRSQESLAIARDREAVTRRAYHEAADCLKAAKSRYGELFLAEEQAEVKRRLEDYRHATK